MSDVFSIVCQHCKKSWIHLDVSVRPDTDGATAVAPRLTCLNCGAVQVFNSIKHDHVEDRLSRAL